MKDDQFTDPAQVRAMYASRGTNRRTIKRGEARATNQSAGIGDSVLPGDTTQGGTVLDIREIGRKRVDPNEIE